MQLAGIILNGGFSSRMGQAKGLLSLPDGRSMLDSAIACLAELQLPIYIAGGAAPAESVLFAVAGHLPDDVRGQGPVGALATVARRALADAYLVLTCDQPLVTAALVATLIPGPTNSIHLFVSESTSDFIPFPGYFPQQPLMNLFEPGAAPPPSMRQLVQQLPVHWISIERRDSLLLRGANTPEEFAALRQHFGPRDATD